MPMDGNADSSGRSARRLSVMLIPALAAGLFGAVIPVVHADCARPTVAASERRVRVRHPFTVRGEDWAEGCNDTTTCSIGCLGCSRGEPSPPARDIQPHIGRRAAPVPRRIVDPAGLFFDGSFDCEIEMRTTADYGLKGNRRTRRRP